MHADIHSTPSAFRRWKSIIQRIRNNLHVTRRRYDNVSGTSGKLLEEEFTTYQERLANYILTDDVTTYQEHLASYLKKLLQRIRKHPASYLKKMLLRSRNIWASYLKNSLQHIRNILQITYRRCYNVSGTSCKLRTEDATTYQEHLACYLKKLFQRIRNVLQIT